MNNSTLKKQVIPLCLTAIVFGIIVAVFWLEISLLNPHLSEKISLQIRPGDILIGMTIYLKTAIDFAIFIGRLMDKNRGLRGRIGIEIGTALGNAVGTMAILLVWSFANEITWLLGIMVLVASLVLLRLAEDGMEHIKADNPGYPRWFRVMVRTVEKSLERINKVCGPVLNKLIPSHTLKIAESPTFMGLLASSFTVPFILGLDDFAGYVPLFSIINVFGFGIGVFAGHMVLNILLYLSPKRTIAAVKNPLISFFGSLAFIGLSVWGLIEAVKLFTGHH